jgi:predicted CoA-binding protein
MDIIDIFRRPEHVLPIVQEAISIKPAVIWMQLGIINEKAAIIAREAGMQVVMDRCIKIDHMNM